MAPFAGNSSMHRNLVIVRAGDESLHTSFLGEERDRTWDILVSCYGKNPDLYRDRGQERTDDPRLSNPAVHALIGARHKEWAERYDYIWFCCDDIISDIGRVNRLFEIVREYQFEVAQPALTLDSIIGHAHLAVNKAFKLRYTTFVESMNPCFSYEFLMRCWPTWAANISGYGIDYLWPNWVEHLSKIAVIDEVPVRHTRSQGALYDGFKAQGVVPREEMIALLRKEKINPIQMVTGGVAINGKSYTIWNGDHRALIKLLIAGYLPELASHPDVIYRVIEPIFNVLNYSDFADMASLLRRLG
jgi:hypothetical protein